MDEPHELREQEKRENDVYMCKICLHHYTFFDVDHYEDGTAICHSCIRELKDQDDDKEISEEM